LHFFRSEAFLDETMFHTAKDHFASSADTSNDLFVLYRLKLVVLIPEHSASVCFPGALNALALSDVCSEGGDYTGADFESCHFDGALGIHVVASAKYGQKDYLIWSDFGGRSLGIGSLGLDNWRLGGGGCLVGCENEWGWPLSENEGWGYMGAGEGKLNVWDAKDIPWVDGTVEHRSHMVDGKAPASEDATDRVLKGWADLVHNNMVVHIEWNRCNMGHNIAAGDRGRNKRDM